MDTEFIGETYFEEFFCPLKVTLEGYGEIDSAEMIPHVLELNDAIQNSDLSMLPSELHHSNVISIRPCIVTSDDDLYGVFEVQICKSLSDDEIKVLREYLIYQAKDGFGKEFERYTIQTEKGAVKVSFWNDCPNYSIKTEDEL